MALEGHFELPIAGNSACLSFRFRKIKQQNADYFQRSGEKKVTEHTNTVLDPDYLDAMVLTKRSQNENYQPHIPGWKDASWQAWDAVGFPETANPPQLARGRGWPEEGYCQGVEPHLRDGTFYFYIIWPCEWLSFPGEGPWNSWNGWRCRRANLSPGPQHVRT